MSKMNLTTRMKRFLLLEKGETLPASSLPKEEVERMVEEGALYVTAHGSRRSVKMASREAFGHYVKSHYQVTDVAAFCQEAEADEATRAELVRQTGDSKTLRRRTSYGFMVSAYEPLPARCMVLR